MDSVKRSKKSDKKKATKDLYGKYSAKYIRITTEKNENTKQKK